MVDFEGMRVFVAIADAGTLTGAAEKLGLTKSTVSRRLATYEHQLGVSLYRRSTRSWQFKKKHPKVKIELVITDENVDLVKEGIDFTVRMGALEDSELLARRIGSGHRSIVASPRLLDEFPIPQTLSDLKRLPAIVTRPDKHLWRFANNESVSVNWEISAGTLPLALDACLQGFGIALIPDPQCEPHIRSGDLIRILENQPLPSVDISLVYPKLQRQSPAARAFLTQVRETFS